MSRSIEENERISKVIEQTAKMRAVSKELKAIAKNIVNKSKETARVDTGRLKRSISYVVNLDGVITFSEVYYGQLDGNSQLLENIKNMFPKNELCIYCTTDDNGRDTEVLINKLDENNVKGNIENTEKNDKKGVHSFLYGLKNIFK